MGAWLVPHLLADGHKVTVYDSLLFGRGFLPDNGMLTVIKGDVRDTSSWSEACDKQDAVIYLASISRELMCQQNEQLAHAVNVAAFEPAVIKAKRRGVRRFIYASSVAVYGSSDHEMTEDEPLAPTTIYGRGKAACEAILFSHQSDDFCCTVTRSASVCGYSPRMRLDLTINRMVHDAVRKDVITVEGGEQVRSHIHIKDICRFYQYLLNEERGMVAGQAYNVVLCNETVSETAHDIWRIFINPPKEKWVAVKTVPRVDNRSYAVSGAKMRSTGFAPQFSTEDAIRDVKLRLEAGYWPDSETNPQYQNLAHGIV